MTGRKLNDTGKVIQILNLLLERATQEGLPSNERDELYDYLGGFLEDNSEGINTTLLEGVQIVLNR
ncbi:MAG: hypothetical protein CME32_24350 [Gimesia sp.]|nr:hypothetical protein [Gimesia sp.]